MQETHRRNNTLQSYNLRERRNETCTTRRDAVGTTKQCAPHGSESVEGGLLKKEARLKRAKEKKRAVKKLAS